LTPSGATWVQL